MTILSTAPQQRVSATQTADELSVLKANENEAIEMFHSDDPEEKERGESEGGARPAARPASRPLARPLFSRLRSSGFESLDPTWYCK